MSQEIGFQFVSNVGENPQRSCWNLFSYINSHKRCKFETVKVEYIWRSLTGDNLSLLVMTMMVRLAHIYYIYLLYKFLCANVILEALYLLIYLICVASLTSHISDEKNEEKEKLRNISKHTQLHTVGKASLSLPSSSFELS